MENINLSRRSVLQKSVAFGCCLSLPLGLISTTTALAENASPQASDKKVTQAGAHYQAKPKEGQSCSACAHFIAASASCKRVDGKISPDGWCMLWTKKA
ncbi:MAG: hypothetical protein HQL45_01085 [Alphaproteobacteria bacterium]|nr:hypothetical protein [Alphaproteobacteria bacterium]